MPIISIFFSGCYSYQPLPNAIKSNNYTTIIKDETLSLPPKTEKLTLELAQELAKKNNPTFIATKHSMTAAWAVFYQSLSEYTPTSNGYFNIGAQNTYPSKYTGYATKPAKNHLYFHSIGMNNQFLIFDGLMRTMNMLSAWNSAKASEEALKDAHRLLHQTVTVTYNSILLAQENIRIAQADLDFNLQLLKDTEIKYEAGAKALIDVLNFRINATQSKNFLIEFQYSLRASKYALAKLLGLTLVNVPKDVKFDRIENANNVLLTDLQFYLDRALEKRPDLEQYRRQLNVAEYYLYSRWGNLFPKVYATNDLDHTQNRNRVKARPLQYTEHSRISELAYGGNAQWTLFEGGKRLFEIREAQQLVAEQEFKVAQKWIEVIKEVRQAHDECLKNTELLILYQKIQAASKQYRDLIEEDYKAGNAPITQLNQAQAELTKNEAQLVQARINLLNARAQLLASVGAFSTIPENLGMIEEEPEEEETEEEETEEDAAEE